MEAQHLSMSLMQLGAYLCMFPKLLEGPIVPYSTIAEDLKPHRITVDCFEEGLRVFTLGLGSIPVLICSHRSRQKVIHQHRHNEK